MIFVFLAIIVGAGLGLITLGAGGLAWQCLTRPFDGNDIVAGILMAIITLAVAGFDVMFLYGVFTDLEGVFGG